MKIYLLSQNDNCGYNTYDSMVVCADSEDDAKMIMPDGGVLNSSFYNTCWA